MTTNEGKNKEDINISSEVGENNTSDKVAKKSKTEAFKTCTLAKYLPSVVTLTSMCFGLSAIRFAHTNDWKYAVFCIFVSAFSDMFDGKIARFLDQSSSFGLELDSLSDLVCFGVAPSIILYSVTMQKVGNIGWVVCLFYTVCCAWRLARYNATHSDSEKLTKLDRLYFTGIPAPAGAFVALFPLVLFIMTDNFMIVRPWIVSFFLIFSGCMMISTIHTFSSKVFDKNNMDPRVCLTIFAAIFIGLGIKFWVTLSFLISLYLVMIPYGIYKYNEALKSTKTN